MIAIYCRVSTRQQQDQLSLDEQEQSGIAFAQSLSEEHRVYKDIKSGKNIVDRDELKALIADIEAGEVGKVWIGDVDRLTRDMEDGGKFKKLLDRYNVLLFDRGRVISSMEFGLRVLLAEEERKRIIERTQRNRRKQIDEGDNRYSSLYGYEEKIIGKSKTGKLIREWVVNEKEKEMIQRIYEWYFQDLNFDQICTELVRSGYQTKKNKSWDRGTIHNILRRPEYTGRTRDTNGNLRESLVYREPIIEKEKWDLVQETIDSKIRIRQGKHFRPASYDCTGIITCEGCRAKYNFHRGVRERTGKTREAYYHKQIEPKQKECSQLPKYLNRETVDYLIKALFVITFSDYCQIEKFINAEQLKLGRDAADLAKDIKRIHAVIDDLSKQKKRLIDSLKKGTLTDSEIGGDIAEIRTKMLQQEAFLKQANEALSLRGKNLQDVIASFAEDTIDKYLRANSKDRRKMNLKYIEFAVMSGYVLRVKYITGTEYRIDLRSLVSPPNLISEMVQLKIADMQSKIDIICSQAILDRENWMPDSIEKRSRVSAAIKYLNSTHFDPVSDQEYQDIMFGFFIKGKGRPRKNSMAKAAEKNSNEQDKS